MQTLPAALAIFAAAAVHAQTPTALNLSHDLTTLGVASSNMVPNTPTLDSRPLFEAGVRYASSHGIPSVLADRGDYYFLTTDNTGFYVYLAVTNVTVDLQYSDLYFLNGNEIGLFCNGCSGVTFQNFTMDYTNLPFTQVQVTGVSGQTVTYQTIPGWPAPTVNLNNYAAAGGASFTMYLFRDAQELRQVGDLYSPAPLSGNTYTEALPTWTTPVEGQGFTATNMSAIEPGDTAVIMVKNNAGMVLVQNANNITFRNVTVYSASLFAFNIQSVSNSTFDQLQVIPRPGTDRLISANADGIHISTSGANNVISNSTVRRGCDDGIIIDAQWAGTVNAAPTGASVPVTLDADSSIFLSVGESVDFIDPVHNALLGTASITAVNPATAQQTIGGKVTITLNQTVAGVVTGTGVIPSDASLRGGGSVIRNNLVQQEVFNRGIYVPGVENVTVTDNMVDSINDSGIEIGENDTLDNSYKTGFASGVTIHNNVVNNAIDYGYPTTVTVETAAAISNVAINENYDYETTMPDSNFTITGNLITNTPRSGIRVQSVNGGTVTGNTIIGANQAPTSYIDDFSASWGETLAQIEADFAQPIVIANSAGVTNSNNTTSGSLVTSVSAAYGGLRQAPGSMVSLYGSNMSTATASNTLASPPTTLAGASVTVTDNTGTSRLAPLYYVSSGLINYQMPAGTAPGIAQVTTGNQIGGALVGTVAPGLFSADGSGTGVAAAEAILIAANGTQTPVTAFQCASGTCTATPMSLGSNGDQLELVLYGTGIEGRSSLTNVAASINGVPASVLYAGSTVYPGLDQVNLIIPSTLAGAGQVPIVLMVDGQTANVLYVNIQ